MRNRIYLSLILCLCVGTQNVYAGSLTGMLPVEKIKIHSTKRSIRYPGAAKAGARSKTQLSPAVVFLEGEGLPTDSSATAMPELRQQGLKFSPRVLPVVVGSTVRFPNLDSVFHNVFSYSSAKRFDLGRYADGEYRDEVFDQLGVVRVYCEIHSHMRGFIVVVPNGFFAVTDESGNFSIDDIPMGSYTVAIWRERGKVLRAKVEIPASGTVNIELSSEKKQHIIVLN